MNFKRILVAINHSPLESEVFDRALHLAQQEQAHLTILHCLVDVAVDVPIESGGIAGLYPTGTGVSQLLHEEIIQSEVQQAKAWLEEYSQKATALGVSTDCQHHFGDPGVTICQIAQQCNADLIILGRHDRSAIVEFFTGDVSNYAIHHATCSVLIIKNH